MSCYSGDRPLTNNMKTSVLKDQLSAMKKTNKVSLWEPCQGWGWFTRIWTDFWNTTNSASLREASAASVSESRSWLFWGLFLYSLYLLSLQCFLSFCQETNFTEFQKCNHQPLVEKDEQEEKININPISKKVGNAAITIIMEPMICL